MVQGAGQDSTRCAVHRIVVVSPRARFSHCLVAFTIVLLGHARAAPDFLSTYCSSNSFLWLARLPFAIHQAYSGPAAALLKYAGAMRVDLQPGDMLYLPALWLHDIETVAVAGSPVSTASDGQNPDDQDVAQWPVSVSYACRFEPRCLRHPPRQKRKQERSGGARHRAQPETPQDGTDVLV